MRHIALEGRCFVLTTCQLLRRSEVGGLRSEADRAVDLLAEDVGVSDVSPQLGDVVHDDALQGDRVAPPHWVGRPT